MLSRTRFPKAAAGGAVLATILVLPALTPTATAEDGTQDRIAVGTLVCTKRSAANDVMAIIRDPDAEDPVRRLTRIQSSGECTDHLVGEHYDTVSVEEAGIVNARVRGLDVYLVTLTGNW
jgi:hypothetical protein